VRPDHLPKGDPCECGEPARRHRAYHLPDGDPCARCGLDAASHRTANVAYRRERDVDRPDRKGPQRILGIDGEGHDLPNGKHVYTFLACVDADGVVAAETRFAPEGLTHDECCEALLSLPKNALKFAYSFGYDTTMILEALPLEDRYVLLRPELRKIRTCRACERRFRLVTSTCPHCGSDDIDEPLNPAHLRWNKRGYGFFQGNLTIADRYKRGKGWGRSVKVHDVFKLFGTSFVEAIKDWGVGDKETVAKIAEMKGKRNEFSGVGSDAIASYCRKECELLAQLMKKRLAAQEEAGIPLTQFFGGSPASALLKKHDVAFYRGRSIGQCGHKWRSIATDCPRPKCEKEHARNENVRDMPTALQHAIMCAFFGGRFENSVIGRVEVPVHGYDLASAYPYALTFLPCLRCGRWRKSASRGKALLREVQRASLALCRFRIKPLPLRERKKLAWAPLPFRDKNGSIAYATNFSGWGWAPEVLAALRGWPDLVEVEQAWLYEVDCGHQPFEWMPGVYRRRVEWGKDGKGKALKNAANGSYGKLAQSKGGRDPQFQQWIWAGMTTATTRGQILDAISTAKNRWNVLAIATDGIYASEELRLAGPRDTSTKGLRDPNGKDKPELGDWEHKGVPEGALLIKPGLYYRLKSVYPHTCKACGKRFQALTNACPDCGSQDIDKPPLDEVRARGVGRREVYEQAPAIMAGWDGWDRRDYEFRILLKSRRFFGARHAIYAMAYCHPCGEMWPGTSEIGCPKCGGLGSFWRAALLKSEQCKECRKKQLAIAKKRRAQDPMAGLDVTLDPKSYCGKCAKPAYGQWAERVTEVAFDPWPKRERRLARGGSFARMVVRDAGGAESAMYRPGKTTPEGEESRKAREFQEWQPEWPDAAIEAEEVPE